MPDRQVQSDLFEDYVPRPHAWDEMFAAPGRPRAEYDRVYRAIRPLTPRELMVRSEALGVAFRDAGITFAHAGEEHPFPLDLVPRLIEHDEWQVVERGVVQRVKALEAFLDDVYGAQQVLVDRIVPRQLVATSAHFRRSAYGIQPPNGVRVHVAGIDLIRDEQGDFRVLEDNIRTPSGVSYLIENRRTMTRVFPDLFGTYRVRPVSEYPAVLLEALRAAAPRGVTEPKVVLLTPGVYNAAYSEHALLARQMGVELVEGRDLVCTGNQVLMRTTAGERPVDVIYRRIDDEFLDPLHYRSDSIIGCPGLLNAARAGQVTIANAVGNGVADDKLVYTYVPDLIRYYLGEEPILNNVETFRLDDRDVLAHVLDNLASLVLKPVDASGGKGIVIGPQADEALLEATRTAMLARPRDWVAQRPVSLSTVPTLVAGGIGARHVDLRPFAVNDGENVWVVPGGLTRVALPEGSLVVNSSQGGGSKDTWVLAGGHPAETAQPRLPGNLGLGLNAPPDPGPGHPAGETRVQQQQQQQNQQHDLQHHDLQHQQHELPSDQSRRSVPC